MQTHRRAASAGLLTSAPSIRQLLLRLVLIVYLPALLAATALVIVNTENRLEFVRNDLLARTVQLSRAIRFHVEGLRSHLERLATAIPDNGGDWKSFHGDAGATAAAAGLDAIVLEAPNGDLLLDTRSAWNQPLRAGTPAVEGRRAKTLANSYLGASIDPASGRLVVQVAVPVVRNGNLLAELRGILHVARLQELLNTTPDGWISAIVDSNGVVIARTPNTDNMVGRLASSDFREVITAQEQGVAASVTLDQVPVYTAFRTPPSIGWTTVLSVPRATLYRPAWRWAAYLAAGAAALLVVALWAAARLRRSIALTVEALVDEAVDPLHGASDFELAFEEARKLQGRLRENAVKLTAARREVDRINAQFPRRLLQQTDRRQAQIATELHDHVGSGLAGLSLLLAHLRAQVAPPGHSLLDSVLLQVDRIAKAVRDISRGIMPAGEQQGGLPTAIEQFVAELSQRDALACDFRWRGDFTRLPAEAAGHLYRIVQEAVANSLRHGGATRVRITLSGVEQHCRLTIDDNGVGYSGDSHSSVHPGMGLRSMRARAQALNGDIELASSPLGGLRVRICWPSAR